MMAIFLQSLQKLMSFARRYAYTWPNFFQRLTASMSLKFAVMGNPIAHSRSPELHQAFGQQYAIALDYQKHLVPLAEFEQQVWAFFKHGGTGLNITLPFKEQAFRLCHTLSESAKIAQAVNTLWMQDGHLCGDNTDGQGLVAALTAHHWPLAKRRILILGAGGASRGVIYPLAQAQVAQIVIANRRLDRAEQLIRDVQAFVPNLKLEAIALDQLSGRFDIAINATSASLTGEPLVLPDALQFNAAYEMAYGKPSSFLATAHARQIPSADGWSMLVGQAIESFAIWHGVRPELGQFLTL
jgi:shikimate dehydrogenase